MEPRHLLQWLLERDGLNSSSLARKIKDSGLSDKPTSQPQIHKFLGGKAVEPKRATLQPVADYFKIPIDAFYDGDSAELTLNSLKMGASHKTNQPIALTNNAQVATNEIASLGDCMAFLATYLSGLEMSDREKAMRDIGDLVKEPETHKKVTAAIEARVGAAFAQSDRKAA